MAGREEGKGGGKWKQGVTRRVDGTLRRLLTTDGEKFITTKAGAAHVRTPITDESKWAF